MGGSVSPAQRPQKGVSTSTIYNLLKKLDLFLLKTPDLLQKAPARRPT